MPLVAHQPLPVYDTLRQRGVRVLSEQQARQQDIRELHVGLLNLMPDAAFFVTEQQYLRLVAGCNEIVQIFVHPFTLPAIARGERVRDHVAKFYEPVEQVLQEGLDALIVTGANLPPGPLQTHPLWDELGRVLDFARASVTSTLCACFSTHVALERFYGLVRQPLPEKLWGVFEHRPVRPHPITAEMNTKADLPHSRWHDVSEAAMRQAGVVPLMTGPEVGVHLATSADGLRFVYMQGHPEYGIDSLLREYRRDVVACLKGLREDYPPMPVGVLSAEGQRIALEFREAALSGRASFESFPFEALARGLECTWRDSARTVFSNWLGLVYAVTSIDRKRAFADGIDPDRPLAAWHFPE